MPVSGLERMEAALRDAARRHRRRLADESDRLRQGFEFRFLLAQLRFGIADRDAVAAASSAAVLPPALRDEIARRLRLEAARLKRFVRTGNPRYDINRHIAVRRALSWTGDATAEAVVFREPERTKCGVSIRSRRAQAPNDRHRSGAGRPDVAAIGGIDRGL